MEIGQTSGVKPPNYAEERYEICKACTEFNGLFKLCKLCGCWMPGKTKIKLADCPLGFWSIISE